MMQLFVNSIIVMFVVVFVLFPMILPIGMYDPLDGDYFLHHMQPFVLSFVTKSLSMQKTIDEISFESDDRYREMIDRVFHLHLLQILG